MNKIGLFWGSDTGMTEEIVTVLLDLLGERGIGVDSINVFGTNAVDFGAYDHYILGLSTWYDGELQSDWEEFYDNDFKQVDFTNKKIALFGLGDQEGYDEYFIDGVGIIGAVVEENGGEIFGKWSTEGYEYTSSKAEKERGCFLGLAIDEDNQPEQTDERLEKWVKQLGEEGFFEGIE